MIGLSKSFLGIFLSLPRVYILPDYPKCSRTSCQSVVNEAPKCGRSLTRVQARLWYTSARSHWRFSAITGGECIDDLGGSGPHVDLRMFEDAAPHDAVVRTCRSAPRTADVSVNALHNGLAPDASLLCLIVIIVKTSCKILFGRIQLFFSRSVTGNICVKTLTRGWSRSAAEPALARVKSCIIRIPAVVYEKDELAPQGGPARRFQATKPNRALKIASQS